MLNLGYACINETLKKDKICVNSSCIASTFREKGVDHAIMLAEQNLNSVMKIIKWNKKKDIKLYRLSSAMFPQITNKEFINEHKYAYQLEIFKDILKRIGELSYNYEHRITFHPDHYNQIGTPREEVLQSTITDLNCHADILDLCGFDRNSVMVVHGGGVYNNKEETIKRWIKQYLQLPENVRNRLVLENCERSYSIEDTLYISSKIKRKCGRSIPCVFDTHHHDVYNANISNLYTDEYYLDDIIQTWDDNDIIPKFHISEQRPNARIGAHSDYVETIHDYFFDISENRRIDIMIEAKMKEKAVLRLKKKYNL